MSRAERREERRRAAAESEAATAKVDAEMHDREATRRIHPDDATVAEHMAADRGDVLIDRWAPRPDEKES